MLRALKHLTCYAECFGEAYLRGANSREVNLCIEHRRTLWRPAAEATRAAGTTGPLQNFYQACVARGVKPHMARLTLARKIAAIVLLVWKKGVCFDAEHLKQTSSLSVWARTPPFQIHFW